MPNPWPENCIYGKKYFCNDLSPDMSSITTDLQTYGYGYGGGTYTDAGGLHIIYHRPSGQPLETIFAHDIFGTMNVAGDFECSFDFKHISFDSGYTLELDFVGINASYSKIQCRCSFSSAIRYMSIASHINYAYKLLSSISNGAWHNFIYRKVGSKVYGFYDYHLILEIDFIGYSSYNVPLDLGVTASSTAAYDFECILKNIRAVTNTGTDCKGGIINDLAKT